MQIDRIGVTKDRLGESVLWDALSKYLYWVDASGGVIRRIHIGTGVYEEFQAPPPVGALCVTKSDRILLILRDGAYYFEPGTGALTPYALLTGAEDNTRLNDAKTDRQGRMVLGSLYLNYKLDQNYRAKFYTFNSDRLFNAFEDNVGITNGPCFSPSGDVLYIADTARRLVWAFDYDIGNARVSGKRVFVDDAVLDGMPDGGTVDAEGCVWFAIMTRSALVRISPAGKLVDTIKMPVNPTSCAFGGANLDILYVTSLSQSVNIQVTAPEAGGLFQITGMGLKGLEEMRFAD